MKYAILSTMILLCSSFGDELTQGLVDDINRYKNEGNYSAAIECTNKLIIEQEKALIISYESRAECYFRTGEFDKAEADYRRAIPSSVDGMSEHMVGKCLLRQKKYDEAYEMLTIALKKLPEDAESWKIYMFKFQRILAFFMVGEENDAIKMFEELGREFPDEEDTEKIILWAKLKLDNEIQEKQPTE